MSLLKKLKACTHESSQLFLENQRYQICWGCGSHRQIGHEYWDAKTDKIVWEAFGPWTKPHLWRHA